MTTTQASLLPLPGIDPVITPLMTQYLAVKARHQDCIVFFRLGDFYEMFFDDALTASKILDIALTRRGQMQGQDVPMCGVPAHSYESYMAKLIRAGHRVALCDQTETPEDAKKRGGKSIVTRDVIRIVTPGTVTEDHMLETRTANHLAVLALTGEDMALAWLDLSQGKPATQCVSTTDLAATLARLEPREILLPQKLIEKPELYETLSTWRDALTPQPNGRFDSDAARRRAETIYGVQDLAAFGQFSRAEITALGVLLDYAELTQKTALKHLAPPTHDLPDSVMAIDPATRRNLELTRTLSGERNGSLLSAIDHTMTGAGARLLAARLTAPSTDVAIIQARLEAVEYFVNHSNLREKLRDILKQTPELERALARLALGRGGPRDLASIRDALRQTEMIRSALLAVMNSLPRDLTDSCKQLGEYNALVEKLGRALSENLPLLTRDGGFIASGFAPHLDEYIMLRDDSRRLIAALQQKYCHTSGVQALKIKHNQILGYYIEVTPGQADKLLAQKEVFIHRQSLATSVRFTSVELSELERKITEAGDKALAIEQQLFSALVDDVLRVMSELRQTAAALAMIDVSAALADLAVSEHYCKPIITYGVEFIITGGRHPVVEQSLRRGRGSQSFVANDCDLTTSQRLWLLTGPNMAGKSTFLRQNALIALLAQTGSFVPAKSATIGVVDRLFSRVGAADDLARGQSTFMVEMIETAAILNQAGEKTLVILDEIGRGTSTYDGLSIAWATLEHLHNTNRCRALFATHYHELTALAEKLPVLHCATIRIREWKNEIVFLHEIITGIADRSYGLHVAQMAGMPTEVIRRANEVLAHLESKPVADKGPVPEAGTALASAPEPEYLTLLKSLKPDDLSPKEALEMIYRLKEVIR